MEIKDLQVGGRSTRIGAPRVLKRLALHRRSGTFGTLTHIVTVFITHVAGVFWGTFEFFQVYEES